MVMTLEAPARARLRTLDFELPAELEARVPPEARGLARDEVRLLVSERASDRVTHATFLDLPRFLDPGDVIVVNDSATLPAALTATLRGGEAFPLHVSSHLDGGRWIVEPRHVTIAAGDLASLPGGGACRFIAPHRGSPRLWEARLDLPLPLYPYLRRWGRPIAYSYAQGVWPIEMYQTVYAARPGSAEMPSAGRAFSTRVLDALQARGVVVAAVRLHTGVASLEAHEAPYEEWFEVGDSAAALVNSARAARRRVVAVGTTVVRALETSVDDSGLVRAARGWTDLVVTPERGVAAVDALLTGFHEPRASHLSMLEALAGRRHLEIAYDAALERSYLWHEFGDLHLIL